MKRSKSLKKQKNGFTNAEIRFLERISETEPDPWGIMAFDALLWGGSDELEYLKQRFNYGK